MQLKKFNLIQDSILIAVFGKNPDLWTKAQCFILKYYKKQIINKDTLISVISTIFIKQIEEKSFKSIYEERYDEEFGSGRGTQEIGKKGIPLPIEPNMYHVMLLLPPVFYLKKLQKKNTKINKRELIKAIKLLGPISAMCTLSEVPIKTVLHDKYGLRFKDLKKYSKNHWQVEQFINKYKKKIGRPTNERVKLSRMQVPEKPLLKDKNLIKYSYRGMEFGKTLINKSFKIVKTVFNVNKLYLHARAGKLKGWKIRHKGDPDWVVPLYTMFNGKWIKTIDNFYAFKEPPYLNKVISITIRNIRNIKGIKIYDY